MCVPVNTYMHGGSAKKPAYDGLLVNTIERDTAIGLREPELHFATSFKK